MFGNIRNPIEHRRRQSEKQQRVHMVRALGYPPICSHSGGKTAAL
jgi:hypothetical protein